MSFKIIADTFSIARDATHFIQLKTVKKPRSDEQIWLAIEIEGETKYARSIVQNIVEVIEEMFFEKTELDTYERFEGTLKEVNLILKNLAEKHGEEATGSISAILGVFSGNELHLTQSKNAEAYLIRRGKLSMISEGLSGKSKDLFVNIASGELMPDDKIIFATSRLLRLMTQTQLVNIFGDGVTEAVDGLRELTIAENDLNLGATCIHVKLPQKNSTPLERAKTNPRLLKIQQWAKKIQNIVAEKISEKTKGTKVNFNRKGILIALVSIVLILMISVSVLMDSRRNQVLRDEYRLRIETMNQDLSVANTKGYANDKETANAILDKVEREARDILGTNYFRQEALALMGKTQEIRDSINNTIRIKQVKPYVDLKTKNPSIQALGMVTLDENFFVYEYNKIYEVILDQVLDPKVLDDNEVVTASTAMEDQGVVVLMTQSGRVMEYQNGQVSFADTNDVSWESGVALAAYGRNVYVLNPTKNQIYKYSRLRGAYTSMTEYNGDADLSNGISMAIDGNVYVLQKGGEITKLFKSKKQPFRVEGMPGDISEVSQIFTIAELNQLYLLDTINKRVVIVEKDRNGVAHYVGEVVFEELDNVKGFYVNKNEDKLYLLTESEIYQVDI
ncbi:hypothetical protein COY07_00590 [Candidatus Peregrinibacteria bacterium CG_4_10_14_0_2_um_filter_43_11]|nr:MAG: hypothetical protein COY07_00590 [Candidatus Peregrinibacteria bacterium CG_4_10_14_0_2_um_filter_43_11]